MMNCGYDPDPNLEYDTPPIAPQIWHAYHIAGEQLATGIIAALIHRHRTGQGQDVSVAVHEAVSKNPELDIMHWVMRRVPLWRLTNRHAAETPNHSPEHQPHQGRALVHLARHGRARPEEPGAAAVEIRHAGGSAAAAAGRRSEGAPGARHRRPATRRGRTCSTSCSASSAPGPMPTCRGARRRMPACYGRRCASRTRTRSTSIG